MKYNWAKVPSVPAVFRILKKEIRFEDQRLSKIFFDALEDFFYYGTLLGYIKNTNFKRVLSQALKIKKVGYLLDVFNGRKSMNINDRTRIVLSKELTDSELKYFMLKEIITNVSSISLMTTRNIVKDHLLSKGIYGEETSYEDRYLEKGFRLIEDGIIYDMTENINYASRKEHRPMKTKKFEKHVFGRSTKFLSNFTYHPVFQELTTMVGRGIIPNSNTLTDEQVLKQLGNDTLSERFTDKLFVKLSSLYGDDVYDIIGKLGIIYKRETDEYGENFIKDNYLRVVHAKEAYKDLYNYESEKRTISKAC